MVHSKGRLTANFLCQETERKIRARVLWSPLGHTHNDLRACDPFLPLQSIITQLRNKSLTYDLWGIFGIKTMGDRQRDRHGLCIKGNICRYPNYLSSRAWVSEFLLTNPDEFAFSGFEFHALVDQPVCPATVQSLSHACPCRLLPCFLPLHVLIQAPHSSQDCLL